MTGAATTPVAGSPARLVEGIANVQSVAANDVGTAFALALRSDGTAAGWGNNLFGALQQPLAVGSLVVTSSPVALDALGAVSQLHACMEYSVALRGDGSVWMLPATASTTAVTARQINGLANVVRLERSVLTASMANCEFLAIDQAGALKAVELTRRNDGSGGLVSTEAVRDLRGLPPVSQAHCSGTDANNRFCAALDLNGRVWTMGGGGLLGDGSTAARTNWAMLPMPTDVKSIEISGLTTITLTNAGAVHCWGSQDLCLAGAGTVLSPTLVPGLPAVAEIAAAPPRRAALQAPVPVALLRPPRTVGRDAVAHQLAQAHAEGALPVLVGEAGIGKTRLLQDFIATRPQALYVQARPSDAGVPYGTLARIVRALAAASAVPADAQTAASAPLATWHAPSTPAQTIDDVAARVAHGAASGIDTLVVDDLHYADRASVEVLRGVLDDRRAGALRWICAHRPQAAAGQDAGLLDALAEAPQVRWLALSPLTEGDVGELLASLGLHDHGRIASLAAALLRHAGGNPLYLIETLRAMTTAGPDDAGAMPRPASIEHLLGRRLRQLSAPALTLARVAAIAGADFSIALAEHALSSPALALADAWAELESADVLCGEAFAHDLIREAVLRATPAAVARRAHEQVAAWCERRGAEPARVAAHWHAAGKGVEAAAAYRQAADRALRSGRTREHCELLEAAAQSHDMAGNADAALRVRLLISDELVHVKGPAAGLAHIERLLEGAQTPQRRAYALRAQAHALLWAGRAADAESSARGALALGDSVEAETRIAAVRMLAHSLAFQGRDDEAVRTLQDAEAAAAALPQLGDQADFLGDFWVLLIRVNRPLQAWPIALRQLELLRREGSDSRLMFSLVSLFGLTYRRGELAQALARAEEAHALVVSGQEQATALVAHGRTNLGIVLCALARYREGLAALREAAALMVAGANPMVAAMNTHRQVEWLIVLGQVARAQALLAGDDSAVPAALKPARCIARALVARALGAAERPFWEQALSLLDAKRNDHERIRVAAELLRFEPDATLALTGAATLQQQAAELGYPPLALGIAVMRLERAVRVGHQREVERLAPWIEAQDPQIGAAFGYLPTQWSACAASYDAIGRPQDATRLRKRAWRWLHESALPHVPPEYHDSFLERNPTNRDLRAWIARGGDEADPPLPGPSSGSCGS